MALNTCVNPTFFVSTLGRLRWYHVHGNLSKVLAFKTFARRVESFLATRPERLVRRDVPIERLTRDPALRKTRRRSSRACPCLPSRAAASPQSSSACAPDASTREADARPALVRSVMSSRSNSASAAKMPKTSLSAAVGGAPTFSRPRERANSTSP